MSSSRLFKFLQSDAKARQFKYRPRYYNKAKEDLDKKTKFFAKEKADLASEEGRKKIAFRDRSDSDWVRSETRTAHRSSSRRFAIIALCLIILTFLYFKKLGISIFGA